MINESSLRIILDLYKKDNITIDETIQLIEDLNRGNLNTFVYPNYPTWSPTIYETSPNFQKYEVTCNLKDHDNNQMS